MARLVVAGAAAGVTTVGACAVYGAPGPGLSPPDAAAWTGGAPGFGGGGGSSAASGVGGWPASTEASAPADSGADDAKTQSDSSATDADATTDDSGLQRCCGPAQAMDI